MGELDHKPSPKRADADNVVAMQTPAPRPKAPARDPDHPTGYAAIDTAGMGPCKGGPDGGGCFLTPGQRLSLVGQLADRIGAAQSVYLSALGDLHVEEVVKKTEELPWYLNLFLAAAAATIEAGIGMALATLKSPGSGSISLGEAKVTNPAAGSEIDHAVAMVSEGKLIAAVHEAVPHTHGKDGEFTDALVRETVDIAKEHAAAPVGRAVSSNSEETQVKQQSLTYIDYLRDRSMLLFQNLRENPRGGSTDAELLAMFESFNIKRHSISGYRTRANEAISRYAESPVSRMGRRMVWDEKRDYRHVELETRVAWLVTKGAGKRLIYVDRAFSAAYQSVQNVAPAKGWQRSSAYDSGETQLSLQQDATWRAFGTDETRHETPVGPDLMLNYVEPEFVEMALEKQQHIWLAAPETFMLDYSYAPPRMVKVAS